jgi:imidazolonepropionase-like amidohydrolase
MSTFRSPCALALACAVAWAAPSSAQDLLPKGAVPAGPVVLRGAVLHTVTGGVVLGGTLWFDRGSIQGVHAAGEKLQLPGDRAPVVVDCAGKHVFPGFVSVGSSLGLVEIGMVRQTVDMDELGELSPEAIAGVAVNPDSAAIPVARSNGVLSAVVFPTGGLLPGRASAMRLDGWTNADMTVRADAGPVVVWPAQSSGERGRRGRRGQPAAEADDGQATRRARQRIDDAFAAARAWLDAFTAERTLPVDVRHRALAPALRGEVPVFVLADDLEQIESAVLWAESRRLRVVIVGGHDAASCAAMLRDRKIPVVLAGVHRLPRRDDQPFDEPFTLPARLAQLGVRFCIATGEDFSFDRNLPYHAATAIAFGLDPQRALGAITHDAAAICGVDDRLGSLAPGKEATLFVADGDPLALTTKVERAWIAGREVDLRNKQTELAKKYRERYRQLDGSSGTGGNGGNGK